MPICKNCHKRIERFNKDRCPVCGVENPFEGMNSDTVEITTDINVDNINIDYHPRTKSTMLLLFVLVGFTGIPFFYLRRKKAALLEIIFSLVLCGLGVLFGWLIHLDWVYNIIIGVALMYFINILTGFIFYFTQNLKDGQGEFVI